MKDMRVRQQQPLRQPEPVQIQIPVADEARKAVTDLGDALAFLQEKRTSLQDPWSLQSMKDLLKTKAAKADAIVNELPLQAQADLANLYRTMVAIYRDGLVSEQELGPLRRARETIQQVLQLQQFKDSRMLGELSKRLFGPLQTLEKASYGQIAVGIAAVVGTNPALTAGVDQPQLHTTWVPLDQLRASNTRLDAIERYNPGDLVGVKRSDGSVTLGVVEARDSNALWVAFRAKGQMASREITRADVAEANPLKIGDAFTVGAKEIIVTGHGPDLKMVGQEIGPPPKRERTNLGGGQIEALAADLAKELAGPPIAHAVNPSPTVVADQNHVVRAGNVESRGVESIAGGEIALTTIIGDHKKYQWNEDSAVMGQRALPDGTRFSYLGVFDQAGGMGKLPTLGQASRDAAHLFLAGVERIANEGAAAPQALKYAAKLAHEKITDANIAASSSACTTYCGAVVTKGRAVIANAGDSRALLISADGRIKERTLEHNYGRIVYQPGGDIGATANIVTSALGGRSKTSDEPTIDSYDWKTERGDWLIIYSDGVGDANQKLQEDEPKRFSAYHTEKTAQEVAAIVRDSKTPEEAADRIQAYALAQVKKGEGKGDNVSVVVQRITE